jgi:hypothetical protein
MTFHIALSAPAGSVMLSDSQGSTETAETHGVQKQYIGEGFLVGGAGASLILNALFSKLGGQPRAGEPALAAADVAAFIEQFFEHEVRPGAMERAELLIVTPSADGKGVQRFVPGVLSRCGERSTMDLIGSGASFAVRAAQRDRAIGVDWAMGSLADLLVFAHDCADAAGESLTVNDKLLVGFLVEGRAYAMGDEAIRPAHIPARIRENWRLVSNYYKREILPVVQAIRDARRHAYRAFSRLLVGTAEAPEAEVQESIEEHRAALAITVPLLRARLMEYLALYDGFLGRATAGGGAE